MSLVTGPVASVATKLLQVIHGEYKLQKDVKKQAQSVSEEMESMGTFLREVDDVPWYQLHGQAKNWAREVRDKSYDLEDVLDTFLVHTEVHQLPGHSRLNRALKKMGNLFAKVKARHDIAGDMQDIMKQIVELSERRKRYKTNETLVSKNDAATTDPRLPALYKKSSQLVGIDEPREELIKMLSVSEDNMSDDKVKTVSIVGPGGLGKTTLARAVYDKVSLKYDCYAFVQVGQTTDRNKVLRDILIDLNLNAETKNMISAYDKKPFSSIADLKELDAHQLIARLHIYLEGKRYKSLAHSSLNKVISHGKTYVYPTTINLRPSTDLPCQFALEKKYNARNSKKLTKIYLSLG